MVSIGYRYALDGQNTGCSCSNAYKRFHLKVAISPSRWPEYSPKSIIERHSSLARSRTLRSSGSVNGRLILGSPFPPDSLNKFCRIFSDDAVSSGTLKEHFEGLEIMIRRLRRDLSDQRISERYNFVW
jgi:hypothetical protein